MEVGCAYFDNGGVDECEKEKKEGEEAEIVLVEDSGEVEMAAWSDAWTIAEIKEGSDVTADWKDVSLTVKMLGLGSRMHVVIQGKGKPADIVVETAEKTIQMN
ncbi:unnamed protein product [Protopolystoma xenopodis]|uniref:Uncharacterized protein n=1 Tax=Protopolystoma xenopodis TaxID=117903 RepID=A0A3S5FDI6_9PLAT|nr:unnamed protein product [Protopolystoma xenopodis]